MGAVAAGGAASPSNPAYTPTELAYQVEATKAKVMIAHVSNIDIAVKAAEMVGLPKSSILIFGNETVNDIRTFRQALFSDKPGSPVKLTSEESETHVAYLCFSSGTTGKIYKYKTLSQTNTNALFQARAKG